MIRTLTGEFRDYEEAKGAVSELEAIGIAPADISLVAADKGPGHDADRATLATEDAGAGIGLGAVIGGAGGLLAGLGALTLPVVGPVVAAGWLVSTAIGVAAGATVGGVAGGLVGALVHAGVPEEEAGRYIEGVRGGGALVGVQVDEPFAAVAEEILRRGKAQSPPAPPRAVGL
ncbi:MAG: hypothetical protein ACYC8V_15010 [Caulobacteraceae bacterium]